MLFSLGLSFVTSEIGVENRFRKVGGRGQDDAFERLDAQLRWRRLKKNEGHEDSVLLKGVVQAIDAHAKSSRPIVLYSSATILKVRVR